MEKDYIKRFEVLIRHNLEKFPKENIALAFSGGIDSSVIAKLMKSMNFKFTAYVVSIEKSKDLDYSRKIAKKNNFKLKEIIVNQEDVEKALPIQAKILKGTKHSAVSIAFNLPLYFVCKNAKEKYIVIAQGPDPLLGGYKRYSKMNKKKAILLMKKETNDFFEMDFIQNNKTAGYFGKKLLMPYIDKEIIDFCLNLEYKFRTNKYILRILGKKIGLDDKTCKREKQACQYGSGIMKLIIKLTKKKGIRVRDYLV